MPEPLLRVSNLTKSYTTGRGTLELFRDLSFTLAKGELLAIVGQSGAGKSSLLHLLSAMDAPDSGDVWLGDVDVPKLSGRGAATFRNRDIGYVWQFHYLLPEFSAEENVAMPLLARGVSRTAASSEARKWLGNVGLADRAEHRSGELSGGEQQRVSLARALVTQPRLLLADEPTGDLDQRTAESVFELLANLHHSAGLSSIVVTHNLEFAARCDRTLMLSGGKLLPHTDMQAFQTFHTQ